MKEKKIIQVKEAIAIIKHNEKMRLIKLFKKHTDKIMSMLVTSNHKTDKFEVKHE